MILMIIFWDLHLCHREVRIFLFVPTNLFFASVTSTRIYYILTTNLFFIASTGVPQVLKCIYCVNYHVYSIHM